MRKLLSNGLVLVTSICGVSGTVHSEVQVTESKSQPDARLSRIKDFFLAHGSPAISVAEEFLSAADRFHLDWRLLPSICMAESGCGKQMRRNNLFGWHSGRAAFSSLRESVHKVAERLANSKLYRNKGLHAVLKTYNPDPEYPALIKRYMRKVGTKQPSPAGLAFNPEDAFRSTGLQGLQP